MDLVTFVLFCAAILCAAIIAMIIRAEDDPKTDWTKANIPIHIKVLIYGVVAGAVVVFILSLDPTKPEGFVYTFTAAYTGLAVVKGIITRAAKEAGANTGT